MTNNETKTTYELLKDAIIKNKERAILMICAVLLFLVGFGTGRAEREYKNTNRTQTNYTTKTSNNKATDGQKVGESNAPKTAPQVEGKQKAECGIKGTASKIYHIPGGAFYHRITSPIRCFATEAEAIAAGYRKSSK